MKNVPPDRTTTTRREKHLSNNHAGFKRFWRTKQNNTRSFSRKFNCLGQALFDWKTCIDCLRSQHLLALLGTKEGLPQTPQYDSALLVRGVSGELFFPSGFHKRYKETYLTLKIVLYTLAFNVYQNHCTIYAVIKSSYTQKLKIKLEPQNQKHKIIFISNSNNQFIVVFKFSTADYNLNRIQRNRLFILKFSFSEFNSYFNSAVENMKTTIINLELLEI